MIASDADSTSSRCKHLLVVSIPPIAMVFAGCMAGLAGPQLEDQPAVYAGVIAFAMVCLLWIVTRELLIEANSKDVFEVWFVNVRARHTASEPPFRLNGSVLLQIWFFVGVMIMLVVDVNVPE